MFHFGFDIIVLPVTFFDVKKLVKGDHRVVFDEAECRKVLFYDIEARQHVEYVKYSAIKLGLQIGFLV